MMSLNEAQWVWETVWRGTRNDNITTQQVCERPCYVGAGLCRWPGVTIAGVSWVVSEKINE